MWPRAEAYPTLLFYSVLGEKNRLLNASRLSLERLYIDAENLIIGNLKQNFFMIACNSFVRPAVRSTFLTAERIGW